MTQKLRLFVLVVSLLLPFAAGAQLTAKFGASRRAGCISLGVPISDSTNYTLGSGHGYKCTYVFYRDSASIILDSSVVYSSTIVPYSPIVNLTTAGKYTVKETVIDTIAGDTSVYKLTDYVYASNPLNISFSTKHPAADTGYQCIGKTVTFVNTSDSVAGCSASYKWHINGPSFDTTINNANRSDTFNITFNKYGRFDVSLVVNSCAFTCNGYTTSVGYIKIDSFPVACFSTIDTTPCSVPVAVPFLNCSSGAGSYFWRFGDGTTSTSANPIHTYNISGNYTDTMIAYSNFAHCATTLVKNNFIRIGNKNFGFVMSGTTGGLPKNVFCQGDSVILKDTTTLAAKHFAWYDNVGNSRTVNPTSLIYSTPGIYTITDSVYTTTGCFGTATKTLTINGLPVVTSVNTGPNSLLTSDSNVIYHCSVPFYVKYDASVAGGMPPFSYKWWFGDSHAGPDSSTLANPVHIFTVAPFSGTYGDTVIVTDANGCSSGIFFDTSIHIRPPVLNINLTFDSGCTPFPFVYTTTIANVGLDSIPFTVDSITFSNTAGYLMSDVTGARTGIDTIRTGDYHTTATFHYHLPAYLGGCGYDTSISFHVGAIHPDLTHITFDTLVCPNVKANFRADSSLCPTCTYAWNFGAAGTGYKQIYDTAVAFPTPGYKRIIVIGSLLGCSDTLKTHDTVHVLPPAMALVGAVQPVCYPADSLHDFAFTASLVTVPGAHVFYRWDWGDGLTSASDTFRIMRHNFPDYDMVWNVTVYDSVSTTGCTNIDTIKVNSFAFVDSFYAKDTSECFGTPHMFYGPLPPYGTNLHYARYVWHWGDGVADTSMSTALNSISHTYATPGNYRDTLIIKNMYGCFDTIYAAKNNLYTMNPHNYIHVGGPVRNASATPLAGCAPDSVVFHDATVDSFPLTKRFWIFNAPPVVSGTGVPSTGQIRVYGTDTSLVFPEGIYNVVLIDSDVLGCSMKDTLPVASQRVHAYFSSPDVWVSGCIGHPYTFTDTNSTCTYAWSFGDGTTGTGQSPVHAYTNTGTYTVKVIVTSAVGGAIAVGCVDSMIDSNYVSVQPMNVGFSLSDTFSDCPPLFVVGSNTTIPPPGGYHFEWRLFPPLPGGALIDTSAYPDNLYTTINTSGTTSTVMLIVSNPIGCRDTATNIVQINGPAGKIEITKTSGCAPLAYDTLSFVDTNGTTSSISNIRWFFGDEGSYSGSGLSGGFTEVHTYMNTGLYHPSVIVDGGGCGNVRIPDTLAGRFTDTIRVFKLVDSVSQSVVICQGASTTLYAFGAGTGGNYVWLPATGLSATTGASVVANPTVTTTYHVVANTANGCYDTMTVNVVVDSVLTVHVHASNAVVCVGSGDSLVVTGAQGAVSWSPSSIMSCATCDSTIAVISDTTKVFVTVTDSFSCFATDSLVINANPLPRLTSKAFDTVCSSVALAYIITSSDTPAVYSWTRASVSGLSNGNGFGSDTIAESLVDTTLLPVAAVYSVTISAHGCNLDTVVRITVNPTPTYAGSKIDSVCSGAPFMHLDSSVVMGTTFTWMRPMTAGILPDSAMGTGNIMDTMSNTGATPVNTMYLVTLTAAGCIAKDTIAVSVSPSPILVGTRMLTPACNDSLVSFVPASTLTPATFAWSRAAVAGISDTAFGSTGSIAEHLSNVTDTNITVVYTYTVSAHGCSSDTNMVKVVVKPTAVLTSGFSDTVCSGVQFLYVPSSATPGLTYMWSRNTPAGISPASGSGADTIKELLENTVSTAVQTSYLVTLNNGGCLNVDTVNLLVVLPASSLHITTEAPTELCQGTMYQNFGASSPASGGSGLIWSATNATISSVGLTQQYCLVSFENPGTAVIHVHSGISGIGCVAQFDSLVVNVGTGHADSGINVVYFEHNLYCLKNDVDGYQWGYDNVDNLDSNLLVGETHQNYYIPSPDLANKYYWVLTYHNGCVQKTYFNMPALGVAVAHTSQISDIKVYPNPSHDFLTVESSSLSGSGVTVSVLNLLGQKLSTVNAPTNKTRVDVSSLPNGSYFVVAYRDGVKFADALFIKD